MCALTSNIKRAEVPRNVLLEKGKANLSKQSVVLVSQIFTVDKTQLGEFTDTLSECRVKQIIEGIYLITEIRNLD